MSLELSIVLLFICLFFLSAFFSGSETAFLNLKQHNKNIPPDVLKFSKKSKHLLIGLLSGNTIVNICIAFLGAYFIHHLANKFIISEALLFLAKIEIIPHESVINPT